MTSEEVRPRHEDLAGLIRLLRTERFQVGTSEAVDATTLIVATRDQPQIWRDRAALRSHLRPIFCKSADEQRRFDRLFDLWWMRTGPSFTPPLLAGPPTPPPKPATARRWPAILIGAAVLALLLYAFWTEQRQSPTTQGRASAPSPVVPTPAPPLLPVGGGRDAGPGASRRTVDRFVPAIRVNVELKPLWALLLAGLPIAGLLAISLPHLVLSRTKAHRTSEPMYLDPAVLTRDARRLVPGMNADIGNRLARHVRSRGLDIERLARRPSLDLRRTIEATIQNHGVPTLRYSIARVHPSYLLLVDVGNETDPRGRLFYQWAERLQREGIEVDLQLLREFPDDGAGTLRVCDPDGPRGRESWVPFEQRRTPAFGERLVVISDGRLFVDADGRWRAEGVRSRFHRWRDRVIFTPVEPRDWGIREVALERSERPNDPGFIVLPLEESALAAWADLVLSGQLSNIALDDPQRFPGLLRGSNMPLFAGDTPPSIRLTDRVLPPTEVVERIVQQLQVYLGERGFFWLAALAIAPVIRWELTLIVGKAVLGRLPLVEDEESLSVALSRNYRRLVRLPWLQSQSMPDWLRLRLLIELSRSQQDELREVVRLALSQLSPDPSEHGIRLNLERPPGAELGIRTMPPRDEGDLIFLGYMSGVAPEQLVMRAPPEWSAWARSIPLRQPPGVRGWIERIRTRARSTWARWIWIGGLPHLGFNWRRAVVMAALMLPLIGLLAAVQRLAVQGPLFGTDWLFAERPHLEVIPAPGIVKVALNQDGTQLAAGYADGTIRLLDPKSGQPLTAKWQGHSSAVGSLAFSADGKQLASGGSDQVLKVWQPVSGEEVNAFAVKASSVTALAFNAEGDGLVFGTSDGGLSTLIIARDRAAVSALVTEDPSTRADRAITRIFFDRRGQLVAMRRDGTAVEKNGGVVSTVQARGRDEWPAAYSPDGGRVASEGPNGTVRLFDNQGQMVGEPLDGHANRVVDVAFSGDSEHIASAGADGTIRMWDARAATPIIAFKDSYGVWSVAFSPDGRRIASGNEGGEIRIHDLRTQALLTSFFAGVGPVRSVAFSPDGQRLVSSADVQGEGGRLLTRVRLWNAGTGEPLPTIVPVHENLTTSVAFSPDGRLLASASDAVRVWDSASGADRFTPLAGQSGRANEVAFRANGEEVAAAGDDGMLRTWELRTGKEIGQPILPPVTDSLSAVSYSGNGRTIAAGGGGAFLWTAAEHTLIGHIDAGRVISLGFAESDRLLVTCGGELRVSDTRTFTSVGSSLSDEFCRHVAIDPAAPYIAQALSVPIGQPASEPSFDGVRVWRLNSYPPPVDVTVPRARRVLDALFTRLADSVVIYWLIGAIVVLLARDAIMRGRTVSKLIAASSPPQ